MEPNSVIVVVHEGNVLSENQVITLGKTLRDLGLSSFKVYTMSRDELMMFNKAAQGIVNICETKIPDDLEDDLKNAIIYLHGQVTFEKDFAQRLVGRIVVCNEKHLVDEKNCIKTAMSIIANTPVNKSIYRTKTAKEHHFTEEIHRKCKYLYNLIYEARLFL